MKKSTYMYLIPIYNRTIFPYQSVRIRLTESNIYNGRNYNNLVGLIPVLDTPRSSKSGDKKDTGYLYGTIVKVTGEDKVLTIVGSSHQAQRSITGLGISRFRVPKNGSKVPQGHVDNVEIMKDEVPTEKDQELKSKGLIKQVKELACQYLDLLHANRGSPEGTKEAIRFEASTSKLLFNICTLLNVDSDEQYRLLCIDDVEERINAIITSLRTLLNSIKLHNDLESKTQEKILAERKTSMLKSKLDEINKMLYGESANEPASLENAIKEANLPPVVKSEVEKELKRLRSMQPHNAEHGVILQYIKTILELPWNTSSTEIRDITKAKQKLDQDHSGLEKVKKRIIEYLAVRNLKGNSKGTIICLCGPPGVGKTSLGKSIAESLGRKFERVSLGGVHDEAEMRGHRRTYIGAMPGVFVKALQRCKTNNPVILLDEIDKLGRDHRGDPSSALLEILDPNQNHTFVDHYLGVPFDLSNIFFIATANKLDSIQPALLDRLEIIQIPGYTFNEKAEIANKYLIPKQIAENGLKPNHMEVTPEALSQMISNFTMEAGVRELERVVASVCRKVAVQYTDFLDQQKVTDETAETKEFGPLKITGEVLQEMMGPFVYEKDVREKIIHPGVATGMAWTSGGGKVLYVETSYSRGKGKIEITGHLGDVMKESVLTAIGWIKSNFHRLGIDVPRLLGKTGEEIDTKKKADQNDPNSLFENIDLYIHFPAAAIPKDGPSAGITITTALVSLFVNRRVKAKISMTGEISLKGLVLPVGGIKEKCIAAHSAGIRKIILPKRNKKDTDEIAAEIKKDIEFVYAETIDDVIKVVLEEEDHKTAHIDIHPPNGVNKLSKL